jgi:hypothetical protein
LAFLSPARCSSIMPCVQTLQIATCVYARYVVLSLSTRLQWAITALHSNPCCKQTRRQHHSCGPCMCCYVQCARLARRCCCLVLLTAASGCGRGMARPAAHHGSAWQNSRCEVCSIALLFCQLATVSPDAATVWGAAACMYQAAWASLTVCQHNARLRHCCVAVSRLAVQLL